MKKKYVSRLLAGCLTVTMLTPTGALASVPQPVVTQEAFQVAGQENETENKEQAEEYAADSAAEVQTDETEAAENRTAADKSREQAEPQTAQTGEQAEPQTAQTGEQAASEVEPQAQVQPRAVVAVNQWIRNGNRWWYRHADGSYTTNGWEVINGAWYYFDGAGWMVTGWLKRPSGWYYLTGSGAMATGWIQLGSTWYYLNESGTMQADTWIGNNYVDGSGAWIPGKVKAQAGWIQSGNRWWYRHADGSYTKNNWEAINGTWYYFDGAGWMVTGWIKLSGTWYYLTGSGAMATGWINLGGTWYYLNPGNGDMVGAGWHLINNKWYYFGGSGAMYSNRWIGNYYVGGNGEMLTNTWVGSYWVGADGKWIPNYDPDVNANWVKSGNTWYYQRPDGSKLTNSWKRINGSWYYFGADGAMTTGWKYVDGYKFYFGTDGKMVQDVDKLIGKQSSYRITVNRVKCQVTVYAANETGNYCIPVKTFTCSVGKAGTPTHAGTYATLKKQNPVELMGPSWGKYGTQINNYGDWFHSVACSNPDPTYALAAGNYNMLGQPASHGCVRLCVRDAKWIYDNCGLYTRVDISDTEYTPFDKAPTIKIPASQNWDPTDADAKR